MLTKLAIALLAIAPNLCSASMSSSRVVIDNSGYKGLVIAIHPDVTESADIIEAIKETWTNASKDLYIATENRAYFKQITILAPKTWTNGNYTYASGSENYDQADVIIAPANPAFGNEPYTVQHDGCGKSGIRTHYTASFLLDEKHVENYGARGKVVVHEWAHYRWGVFDETSKETPFYWDPEYGSENGPVATQCPRDMTGEIRNVEHEYERCTLLDFDEESNSYPDYCVFFPYELQYFNINTSMMTYQYLDDVVTFCKDKSDTDSYNAHNIYAPTSQNAMCSMKSTWSVIKDSSDFLEWSENQINNYSDLIPEFTVVKPQAPRFVLVLDDSGSMTSRDCDGVARFECVKTAANLFLTETVPDGSYVGIVIFGSNAYIQEYLTFVNSEQARTDLANSIIYLDGGSGGTCIGCGIDTGIDVLEYGGKSAAGGQLIVITDGQGSLSSSVVAEALNKGVIINTIFLVTQDNQELKDLTDDSGGKQFYAMSQSDLLQIFSQLSSSDSTEDNSYQIHSDSFEMSAGDKYNATVLIDKTIGRSTVFTFTWTFGQQAPDIDVLSPEGCFYSNSFSSNKTLCSNATYDISTEFRTIKFKIPGVAEVGNWIYTVSSDTTNFGTMTSLVTSAASNNSIEPIIIESGMSQTQVDDGGAPVVYAKVTQGYNPVLGAIVKAKITGSSGQPKVIDLYDNGAGCDITRDDGIYSRYFTEFTGGGRYSVEITITNGPVTKAKMTIGRSSANYKPGLIAPDGVVNANPNGAVSTEGSESATGIQSQDLGDFSRVVPSESFDYTGTVNVDASGGPTVDNFPPSKIIDVKIQQNDLEDYSEGIIIQFTAPGDDFDKGQAAQYDFRYTFDDPTALIADFDNSPQINETLVLRGNLSDPSPSGTQEEFLVKIPDLPVDATGALVNNSRLAFSVKAFDMNGNAGEISNIAITNFFIAPVIIPTVAPTTPEATTAIATTSEASSPTEGTPEAATSEASIVTTQTRKVTTTKITAKTISSTACPKCEACDPSTGVYVTITSLTVTTGIFLTSTLILAIWLSRANKDLRKANNSHLRGVENALEMRKPVERPDNSLGSPLMIPRAKFVNDYDF